VETFFRVGASGEVKAAGWLATKLASMQSLDMIIEMAQGFNSVKGIRCLAKIGSSSYLMLSLG